MNAYVMVPNFLPWSPVTPVCYESHDPLAHILSLGLGPGQSQGPCCLLSPIPGQPVGGL